MTPLQFRNAINPIEFHDKVNIKRKGINVEVNLYDDEDIFSSFIGGSSSKRKKSRDANNCSTKNCMKIVITFPNFNEGSKNYSLAIHVFIKKQNCEAFMFPSTNEAKMMDSGTLIHLMRRKKIGWMIIYNSKNYV
ncbi:hypothetical protein R6Q57_014664 [Mikania cordata]